MRNKVSCSAEQLSQLNPDMIQSVVGSQVFKLGNQYFTEHRVRIVESNDQDVSAEVDGTYGVYSQTIRLRGGNLATKCSCPSSEQPFCRHCVAVLLHHFHSWVNQDEHDSDSTEDFIADQPHQNEAKPASSSLADLKFHEVTMFIDWMQSVTKTLDRKEPLPTEPTVSPGTVKNWVEGIKDLYLRYERSEEHRISTDADLRICEERLDRATQELEGMTREAKAAQASCAGLQRELESCQGMLQKFSEVSKSRDRLQDQFDSLRNEMLRRGMEIDHLTASLQEISSALQAVPPPSS